MNVLVIGQSNGARWFTNGGQGADQFVETCAAAGVDVSLINACVGGTGLVDGADGWDAWSDDGGNLYRRMLAKVDGKQIDAVLWIQGEEEAQVGTTAEAYCDALGVLFDNLRANLGDVTIFVQQLAYRGLPSENEVRSGQENASSGNAVLVGTPAGLFLPDGLHYASPDYRVLADNMARAFLDTLDVPVTDALCLGSRRADKLTAGDGDDAVFGFQSTDKLIGGRGSDTLVGGYGADTLMGGRGHDELWGEGGRDVFVLSPGGGVDEIHDFSWQDRIVIRGTGDVTFDSGTLYYDGRAIAHLVDPVGFSIHLDVSLGH